MRWIVHRLEMPSLLVGRVCTVRSRRWNNARSCAVIPFCENRRFSSETFVAWAWRTAVLVQRQLLSGVAYTVPLGFSHASFRFPFGRTCPAAMASVDSAAFFTQRVEVLCLTFFQDKLNEMGLKLWDSLHLRAATPPQPRMTGRSTGRSCFQSWGAKINPSSRSSDV